MKALIVMNHELTEDQEKDLKNNWNITHIWVMSTVSKSIWRNIPPNMDKNELKKHIKLITEKEIKGFNFIIIAGELTACTIIIDAARRQNIRVLTATSQRESVETVSPSGETVKKSVFKHVRFREI